MIFVLNGGGAGLNYKVVCEATQPSNLKENTIWVQSSTAMSDYVLSPNQPTGVAGRVWIQTGTGSTNFNALKKNSIVLRPSAVKQYVGSVWIAKASYIYQNGTLKNWNSYLFRQGAGADVAFDKYNQGNSSVTIGTDSISIAGGHTTLSNRSYFSTTKSLDLTKYTMLCVEYICTQNAHTIRFGITSSKISGAGSATTDFPWTAYADIAAENTRKTVKIDIQKLTSGYMSYSGGATMTVYNIWLES